MEAVAICDYQVQAQGDEFTLTSGLEINILDNSGDFFLADIRGEERYVPGNYVKLKRDAPWFLGHIERLEAEDILRNKPHGSFLIRNRQMRPNDNDPFGLSVKNMNATPPGIQHYKIPKDEEGRFCLFTERKFESLDELVCWYSDPTNDGHDDRKPQLLWVDLGVIDSKEDIGDTDEAIALFSFKKEEMNELSFDAGSHIVVHEKIPVPQEGRKKPVFETYDDSEWLYGHLKGKSSEKGFFPREFVRIL